MFILNNQSWIYIYLYEYIRIHQHVWLTKIIGNEEVTHLFLLSYLQPLFVEFIMARNVRKFLEIRKPSFRNRLVNLRKKDKSPIKKK